MKLKKILHLLNKEPRLFLRALISKIPPCLFPDGLYLKCLYRLKMKKRLNLSNPKTFNEKLQYLKLHDRNPEYIKWWIKLKQRNMWQKK